MSEQRIRPSLTQSLLAVVLLWLAVPLSSWAQSVAPTADAGEDQTIECASPAGALVTLDGSDSFDPDNDIEYRWLEDLGGGTLVELVAWSTSPTAQVTLGLGVHTIVLEVAEIEDVPAQQLADDTVIITIVDTTPPDIVVSATPIVLWAPDHKYRTIGVADFVVSASDVCDASVGVDDVVIASVSSDEPENGTGDGNTVDDIAFDSCTEVDLRAERSGSGNGRVYSVNVQVADASGNVGSASAEVQVPKSRNRPAVADAPVYSVDGCDPASAPLAARRVPSAVRFGEAATAAADVPDRFSLEGNYPNPFNPSTHIVYTLAEQTHVRLAVYDVTGRQVARLVDRSQASGRHEARFEAVDLPSGVYIYRLEAGAFTAVRSMLLTK